LSPAATTHGEGGVWAALAYVGGVGGMVFVFIVAIILARAAFESARAT
jgi:Trk-type K+ transport system membrane component